MVLDTGMQLMLYAGVYVWNICLGYWVAVKDYCLQQHAHVCMCMCMLGLWKWKWCLWKCLEGPDCSDFGFMFWDVMLLLFCRMGKATHRR